MKREDIAKYSGKTVELTLMPDAEKRTGIIHCKEDHVEINDELLAYPLIWGVRVIDPVKTQPSSSKQPVKKESVYSRAVKCVKTDEAMKLYFEAIKVDDHRQQAVNVLFGIYTKQENYHEARKLLETYGASLKEDTLAHHWTVYYSMSKDNPEEFIKFCRKKIKACKDIKKKFMYLRQKANLEYSSGQFAQAVSTCDMGLREFHGLRKIPEELQRIEISLTRIKALSLHGMGSKKARALAEELMKLPEFSTDGKLQAILEDKTNKNEEIITETITPEVPIWEKISQVHNAIRNLIRSKLPEALKIKPKELDEALLRENIIPNPAMHNTFIENNKQNHNVNSSLIDVVSIEILGGIMGRYWESVFAKHFGNKPYYGYWLEKFSRLNVIRNSIAHAHSEYLSNDDVSEAEEICNEILGLLPV